MAYMNQEMKKEKESNIKKILKSHKIAGSLSVRNHSTLVLTLRKGKYDFISEYNFTRNAPFMVNRHDYRNMFSENIVQFFDDVFQAMNEGNWNNSRPEIDHFDIGWYVEVNVGTWKSPYQLM